MTRREELAAGLAAVRDRIERACEQAGRDPGEVTLVVVTKFFPAADVRVLHDLGVRDVGENRHQEAESKAASLSDLDDLRWHFIGGLQSNKAAAVASYADVVHSLDRAKLVDRLDSGARAHGRVVDCLVQVSLDPPDRAGRAGADPQNVPALADRIAAAGMLRLRGVMAVAPLGGDASAAFAELAAVAAGLRRTHPEASWVSAGMSGDLEAAVASGATHVRVGSAILGPRPPIK